MTETEGDRLLDLFKVIREKTGLTEQELRTEVEKKRAEYEMLTEEGALTLIASEVGAVLEESEAPPSMKLADLRPGMQDLNVVGRIVRIERPREFRRRDGSPGYVCGLMLADKTGQVRVTLWDQECRLLEEVEQHSIIKIVGGICKSGRRGLEIHTARRARFVLGPKVSEDPRVSDLDSVTEEAPPEPSRQRVSELEDGDSNVEIRSTIARFYRVWVYDACPDCARKVVEGECPTCGPIKAEPRAILDIGVDDSTGFVRAKLFGEVAEELLGSSAGEIRAGVEALVERGMEPRRASEEYLNREHMEVLGEEILLRGRVALDEYRGLVISVDDIASPDIIKETKMILQEVGG